MPIRISSYFVTFLSVFEIKTIHLILQHCYFLILSVFGGKILGAAMRSVFSHNIKLIPTNARVLLTLEPTSVDVIGQLYTCFLNERSGFEFVCVRYLEFFYFIFAGRRIFGTSRRHFLSNKFKLIPKNARSVLFIALFTANRKLWNRWTKRIWIRLNFACGLSGLNLNNPLKLSVSTMLWRPLPKSSGTKHTRWF